MPMQARQPLDGGDAMAGLRARAEEAISRVQGLGSDAELLAARELVLDLRNARLYGPMAQLAEALSRRFPADARNRRLYAQCQIEQGRVTAAIDMLKPLLARLPPGHPEHAEALGLLGRAHKQIFLDAADKTGAMARLALRSAIASYRKAYEHDRAHTWQGVNLVALLARARRLGLRFAPDLQLAAVAQAVLAQLQALPPQARDEWHGPSLAEAALGLGDWAQVEAALHGFVADERAQAFQIGSTLRQFTQLWDIESIDARGRALADILRARLLQLPGGGLALDGTALQQARARPEPPAGQLEAVLGAQGAKAFRWWKLGLERASAVCLIRSRAGERVGTGWLVRAGSLLREPAEELLVLTNCHVVNAQGQSPGLAPEAAELVFEAADPGRVHHVAELLWSSPPERHDVALLRLAEPVVGIQPLPLARALPPVDDGAHVYVIGHAGGRDLAISMQDNALLDHEGPPAGTPALAGVCRVHYRAPTEGGSSGSPVFDAAMWEVIALHHKGGRLGMPRLNGKPGSYGANQGVSLLSIIQAMAAS